MYHFFQLKYGTYFPALRTHCLVLRSVEGIHNSLNKSVSNSHPNIWKLINALKSEEGLAVAKRIQQERGDTLPMRKKYRDLNVRLGNLMSNYDSNNKLLYLKGIAYNIHIF